MSANEHTREQAYTAEQWRQQFGLSFDPFHAESVGSRCFFGGAQRQELLDNLRHLVHFSDHILVVTGDKGSGKTCLLEQLTEYEKEALKIVWLRPKLLEGRASLIVQMAKLLGVVVAKGDSTETLSNRILETCSNQYSHGLRTLFVIDDAHELSDESIELLAKRFNPRLSGAFGLVLLAQQQMVEQIRRLFPESQSQPFHQLQLRNFSQSDTADFVLKHLQQAGWTGSPGIDQEALIKIHKLGKGLPGRIVRTASSVLLSGVDSVASGHGRISQMNLLFAGLVGLALVLAVILISLQYDQDEEAVVDEVVEQSRYTIALPVSSDGDLKEGADNTLVSDDLLPLSDQGATEPRSASEEDLISAMEKTEVSLKGGSQADGDPVESADSAEKGEPSEKADKVEETVAESAVADKASSDDDSTKMVHEAGQALTEVQPKVQKKTQKEVSNKEPHEELSVNKPSEKAGSEPSRQVVVADERVKAQVSVSEFKRTAEWVEKQPQGSWTIQVLGSFSSESATEFLKGLDNTEGYFYVKSDYQGKDWYVVLHGVYLDKTTAREGLGNLPANIQEAGAWIRSLGGLHVASD
ncbi:AAA family ATPase [Hahella ganghwensis]|uniref:AAA family ATPase n=1 Tax=Hahella ganghwensis TaxID=286420 RepID=UPI0003748F36|nr:AAA family ATPase [Hahella ganghwensis]